MKNYFNNFSFFISHFSFQKGFTLIEIMIAVALIAVLGTWVVSLINPVGQFKKGRDAERKSELRQLQAALELYRSDKGIYPPSLPACNDQPLEDGGVIYIQKVPCDPKNIDEYIYHYDGSQGVTYVFVACLENVNDSQKDTDNNNLYCTGGDTNWSYTLTNP